MNMARFKTPEGSNPNSPRPLPVGRAQWQGNPTQEGSNVAYAEQHQPTTANIFLFCILQTHRRGTISRFFTLGYTYTPCSLQC